jgi:hypothetical protein
MFMTCGHPRAGHRLREDDQLEDLKGGRRYALSIAFVARSGEVPVLVVPTGCRMGDLNIVLDAAILAAFFIAVVFALAFAGFFFVLSATAIDIKKQLDLAIDVDIEFIEPGCSQIENIFEAKRGVSVSGIGDEIFKVG